MTDNRTTELREKLTERGIEYETNDYIGVCETSWNGFTAMQLTPGAKLMMVFTPEQAIAATLGNAYEQRIKQLESLVRDMWFKNIGRMDYCGWCVIECDNEENCELAERMDELGLMEVGE